MFRPEEIVLILEQAKRYTDSQRLGYSQKETSVIVPKAVYSFTGVDENTNIVIDGYMLNGTIVGGETYTVTVNGDKYICEAKSYDMDGAEAVVVGNTLIFDEIDNGIPWVIMYVPIVALPPSFVWLDQSTEDTTISITTETETIHPIPAEYIPPLDALYLNGTDGQRYKLYVDESGVLQTEVTA